MTKEEFKPGEISVFSLPSIESNSSMDWMMPFVVTSNPRIVDHYETLKLRNSYHAQPRRFSLVTHPDKLRIVESDHIHIPLSS